MSNLGKFVGCSHLVTYIEALQKIRFFNIYSAAFNATYVRDVCDVLPF